MEVGKLYQTKRFYWLFFPSKDIAADNIAAADVVIGAPSLAALSEPEANYNARYYSEHLKCEISYIDPSMFVLLEQDGILMKLLTTDGSIGWIYASEWYKKDIEEVVL